jgi:hypothetical protein
LNSQAAAAVTETTTVPRFTARAAETREHIRLSQLNAGLIMKFFANKLNGNYLRSVLPDKGAEVDWVKAAIAYGSDAETLIADCLSSKYRLDIWMRYDHTVPVAPALLRKLLDGVRRNIFLPAHPRRSAFEGDLVEKLRRVCGFCKSHRSRLGYKH